MTDSLEKNIFDLIHKKIGHNRYSRKLRTSLTVKSPIGHVINEDLYRTFLEKESLDSIYLKTAIQYSLIIPGAIPLNYLVRLENFYHKNKRLPSTYNEV